MKGTQAAFDPIEHLEACFQLKAQRIGREGSVSLGFHTAIVLDNHQDTLQEATKLNGGYEELAKSMTLYSHREESQKLAPHLDRLEQRIQGVSLA